MKTLNFDNELFQECIDALQPDIGILSKEESDKIINLFEKKVPIYEGGSRVDWSKIAKRKFVENANQIIPSLSELIRDKGFDLSVYVFWNDASLPVIKSDLKKVIEFYDDVVSVDFETWLYNPEKGYLIENYYLNEIHAGLI